MSPQYFQRPSKSNCRHITPARFDDEVTIKTTVSDPGKRLVPFAYEMSCTGRKIAIGRTKHIFLNRELHPVKLPGKYWQQFGIS